MNINDTFPPRNLPTEAVQWGRAMEGRIRDLQSLLLKSQEDLKNGNRTTAAVTSELARQLDKLEEFLTELEGLLAELQDLLAELEDLYNAIPKTFQLTNRTTGFASSSNWVTVNTINLSFPEGTTRGQVSAFGAAGLNYAGSGVTTIYGRVLVRNGSGPYVKADELFSASGWAAILTPQQTRDLDWSAPFTVEFQVRAEDSASFPANPDNYASLTVLASFTGV